MEYLYYFQTFRYSEADGGPKRSDNRRLPGGVGGRGCSRDHRSLPVQEVREIERERERNVLFNDALNTFYLRLYGIRHMVKDHSDNKKGNPLPPHRLPLLINSKVFFIFTIPQTI